MKRLLPWLFCLIAACSTDGVIEYPKVQLHSAHLDLVIVDHRKGPVSTIKPPRVLERDETETYAEVFPADAVASHLEERLARLRSTGGTKVLFEVSVERADATIFSHYVDEFVRYDVTLRVEVRTENGHVLNRGKTSAWRKLPREQATDEVRVRTHVEAAVAAFDQYFADEDRLNALNASLAAAEKSR
jgi:hypothetical protein